MRLATWVIRSSVVQGDIADESYLRYVKQLGIADVVWLGPPPSEGEKVLNYIDILHMRRACEDAGLRLVSVENVAYDMSVHRSSGLGHQQLFDPIILGLPGRDEALEILANTIRNIGRAGVPYFGYHWMVSPKADATAVTLGGNPVYTTSFTTRGRGGALVRSFDLRDAEHTPLFRDRVYSQSELWDNHDYFLRAIVPVAEEAGVVLSLHPSDPPVDAIGGIPRLFINYDAFDRAIQSADSDAWGLTFCLGNWGLMGDGVVEKAIRHFGTLGKICYVHFQANQGTNTSFTECFFDEGDLDFFNVIESLIDVGFDGSMLPSHFPKLEGDGGGAGVSEVLRGAEGLRGLAYAVGYLQGLLRQAGKAPKEVVAGRSRTGSEA